jgi:FkbM family methyltransferase
MKNEPEEPDTNDLMDDKLIFDVGFHKGEDTRYYLHLGYRVVAVDADPKLIAIAEKTFKEAIDAGILTLVHCAISGIDNGRADLHVSNFSLWTSLHKNVANRQNKMRETISVPTCRLDTLFAKHRVPYYCKIDIEGSDGLALTMLRNVRLLPKYISVETECIGEHELINDDQALETLTYLYDAGYRRFKLVDQNSLKVLSSDLFFAPGTDARTKSGDGTELDHIEILRRKHRFNFAPSATGPFGEDLEGSWVDYQSARELLLFHRRTLFAQKDVSNFDFWCDWHATN